jgi:hypothetical protein
MSRFKIGDKVRVSQESASRNKGRIGTVDKIQKEDFGFVYTVKLEPKDLEPPIKRFVEEDLELV